MSCSAFLSLRRLPEFHPNTTQPNLAKLNHDEGDNPATGVFLLTRARNQEPRPEAVFKFDSGSGPIRKGRTYESFTNIADRCGIDDRERRSGFCADCLPA